MFLGCYQLNISMQLKLRTTSTSTDTTQGCGRTPRACGVVVCVPVPSTRARVFVCVSHASLSPCTSLNMSSRALAFLRAWGPRRLRGRAAGALAHGCPCPACAAVPSASGRGGQSGHTAELFSITAARHRARFWRWHGSRSAEVEGPVDVPCHLQAVHCTRCAQDAGRALCT